MHYSEHFLTIGVDPSAKHTIDRGTHGFVGGEGTCSCYFSLEFSVVKLVKEKLMIITGYTSYRHSGSRSGYISEGFQNLMVGIN